jgi:hypothetical protein
MSVVDNGDWLLFLSLERDLENTLDYVPIDQDHYGVYSIAYLKLLLVACSAVEQLGKKLCGLPLEDKSIRAEDIAKELVKIQRFSEMRCDIPRYGVSFLPWEPIATNKTPPWWVDYNNSKHASVRSAKQENVLDSLAALFCLNLAYYKEKVITFDPRPVLYDHPSLGFTMVGGTGRGVMGKQ